MQTMRLCINLSNKFESFWKFISKKLEMEPMWFCNARSNWFLNLNKCYKCDCAFFGASDLRQHLETHSAVEESQRNVVNVSLHLFQKRVSKAFENAQQKKFEEMLQWNHLILFLCTVEKIKQSQSVWGGIIFERANLESILKCTMGVSQNCCQGDNALIVQAVLDDF